MGIFALFFLVAGITIAAAKYRHEAEARGEKGVIIGGIPRALPRALPRARPLAIRPPQLPSSRTGLIPALPPRLVPRPPHRGERGPPQGSALSPADTQTPPYVRLYLRVRPDFVDAGRAHHGQRQLLETLRQRLLGMGHRDVRAIIQDPTDNNIFTAIALLHPTALIMDPEGAFEIIKTVPVEPPPANLHERSEAGELDPGLSKSESDAVRFALLYEPNPRHLAGFASTLEPYFPIGASLLRAKAMLRESEVYRNRARLVASNQEAGDELLRGVAEQNGNTDRIGQWLTEPAPPAIETLARITNEGARGRWPDVEAMWQGFQGVLPDRWYRLDRMADLSQSLAGGTEPDATVADLWERIQATSAQTGIPVAIYQDDIRYVGCVLLDELQSRLHAPVTEEIDHLGEHLSTYPPEVIELGRRLVDEIGLGVWILSPQKLREICPPHERDGYVSPAALQLALASWKPEMSGVLDPSKVQARYAQTKEETPEAYQARHELQKADRALERRRWIDWYHRVRASGRPLV